MFLLIFLLGPCGGPITFLTKFQYHRQTFCFEGGRSPPSSHTQLTGTTAAPLFLRCKQHMPRCWKFCAGWLQGAVLQRRELPAVTYLAAVP